MGVEPPARPQPAGTTESPSPAPELERPSAGEEDQVGENISCTEEVKRNRERHIEVLRDVKRRHRDALFTLTGVWGVGVGSVYSDGERTREVGITVHIDIDTEAAPGQSDPKLLIPSSIEGCTVDVQVGKPPVPAAAETPSPTAQSGPLVWGDKISCTEEVKRNRDRHVEALTEVRARHHAALMAIPGVYGAGIGYIYAEGKRTSEIGITVKLSKILPPGATDPKSLVPSAIEGCTVSARVSDAEPRNVSR